MCQEVLTWFLSLLAVLLNIFFNLYSFLIFFNCENIRHLQETWKIQNKVIYSSTVYYYYFF